MANRLSKGTIERIRTLYLRGISQREISKETGVNYGTIGNYTSAWNLGFKSPMAYLNKMAQRRGFEDYNKYQQVSVMINKPDPFHYKRRRKSEQNCFEDEIEVQSKRFSEGLPSIPQLSLNYDVEQIMERLGRIKGGAKMAWIIREIYFNGKNCVEIGKDLEVSGGYINQLKIEGLSHLKRMAKGGCLDSYLEDLG